MRLSAETARQAGALVEDRLGLEFLDHRRGDLERGILEASGSSPLPSPEAYLAWLATIADDEPEWKRLAAHLTVGETYFFRDRGCFDALEHEVLPRLVASRRSDGVRRLRIWSAGCASGEEPYSLAIMLDRLLPDRSEWSVTILATDISVAALKVAHRATYREWSLRDTPSWLRGRYFQRSGRDAYLLDPRIQRMVAFAPLNLASGSYPSHVTNTTAMDLILCRNVLMYFSPGARSAAIARLHASLADGGWLAVSAAEGAVDLFQPLAPVTYPGAVLYRRRDALPSAALPLPSPVEAWSEPAVIPPVHVPSAPHPAPIPRAPREEPTAGQLIERARTLAGQGRLEEAQRLCRDALARDRLAADAYLLIAAICQERQELPEAIDALRRALYIAPESAPAHFVLGSLLLQRGDQRQGSRCMETVVRLLGAVPRDKLLDGGEGLTAGRLLETARLYLESIR